MCGLKVGVLPSCSVIEHPLGMAARTTCALNWSPVPPPFVSLHLAAIGAKAGFYPQTTSDGPVPAPGAKTGPVPTITKGGLMTVHLGSEGMGGMIETGRGGHEGDDFLAGGILHQGRGREIDMQRSRDRGRGRRVQGQRAEAREETGGQGPTPLHVDVADAPGLIKGRKVMMLEEGVARAEMKGHCRASGQGIGTTQALMSAHRRRRRTSSWN